MPPTKPAHVKRLRVIVMVGLDRTATINADFAGATNENAFSDRVLRLVLSASLLGVIVRSLLGADSILVPMVLGTVCRSHLLRIGITVRLRASGVDRAAFVTSAAVALVCVASAMNDLLLRHEPAY